MWVCGFWVFVVFGFAWFFGFVGFGDFGDFCLGCWFWISFAFTCMGLAIWWLAVFLAWWCGSGCFVCWSNTQMGYRFDLYCLMLWFKCLIAVSGLLGLHWICVFWYFGLLLVDLTV